MLLRNFSNLLLLCLSCIFLGGENVFKRSAQEVNERAFRDAGEPLVILVFSWARASFDNSYKKRKKLTDYFISLGANTINFVNYSDSNEIIAKKMADSNLIYLTGGQTSILVERLKKHGYRPFAIMITTELLSGEVQEHWRFAENA